MTTTRSDQLIEEYLARLADAAAALPPAEREDLVSDIREHITVALDEEVHLDEAAVRNLLTRLGPPEDVVAGAVVYLLRLPGVDPAVASPVPVPTTPAAVPVLAMGPVAAAYLSSRVIGRIRAHRPSRPRLEPA